MTVEVDKVKFPTTHVLIDTSYDLNCRGTARTQSPTTKNYTPEFPTTGESQASTIRSAMEWPPPEPPALMITGDLCQVS